MNRRRPFETDAEVEYRERLTVHLGAIADGLNEDLERDWVFEIDAALGRGHGDWFTSDLLRLIAKADRANTARLRVAFPHAVAAYERWHAGDGEFR